MFLFNKAKRYKSTRRRLFALTAEGHYHFLRMDLREEELSHPFLSPKLLLSPISLII